MHPDDDPDYYAHTRKANEQRRAKAERLAEALFEQQVSPADAAWYDEMEQRRAEKTVGIRTSHRDVLWQMVIEHLTLLHTTSAAPQAEPDGGVPVSSPAPAASSGASTEGGPASGEHGAQTCGCPASPARTITDPARHAAWHQLVVEQGGPVGEVNVQTCRTARGNRNLTPDSVTAPIHARHEQQGKSSPGWRREATR